MNPEPQDVDRIQDPMAFQREGQAEEQTAGPNGKTAQAESSWISKIIDNILPTLTSASTNNTTTGNEAAEGELSLQTLVNSSGEY